MGIPHMTLFPPTLTSHLVLSMFLTSLTLPFSQLAHNVKDFLRGPRQTLLTELGQCTGATAGTHRGHRGWGSEVRQHIVSEGKRSNDAVNG